MGGWTVVLRGVRYRSGRSLMVLLLAAVATAATVLAPAYTRAAQQSVLTDRLAAAPANATSLHLISVPQAGEAPPLESTTEAKLTMQQLLARTSALHKLLGPPVAAADVEASLISAANAPTALIRMAYRDSVCAHVTMTQGECSDDAGGVIVSARSATAHGLTVGKKLSIRGRSSPTTTTPRNLTIVGLYTPRDTSDPYWGQGGYFSAGVPAGDSALPRMDAAFVGDEVELTLPNEPATVQVDYRLRTDTVSLDDVAKLRGDLSSFETAVNASQVQLTTALRGVLDDVDAQISALARTVPIVAVPLVLVCWFVLFLLVAALTEERTPEVGLAKLRGYPARRAARFGRGEALLLVVLAVPLGLLLGLAIVEVAARVLLADGVHAQVGWPVLGAAAVALVAAFLAVRLATARSLSRPVLALLRRVPERTRWRAGVADGAIVALAIASLAVAFSDPSAPLALLAPALIALVAGVVVSRLLGLWSRARVHRHARKGRVTGLLAHAQLSRRAMGHRVMLVVTVAVALLSFAAIAWDAAAQARGDVAADTVGANQVLLVNAEDAHALVDAVNAVGGGQAMAVVRATERYAGTTVELVGLDSAKLADVAIWRGHSHAELASLATQLRPPSTTTDQLPAAVAGNSPADDAAATLFTFPGLGENAQRFTVVERSPALPRVGTEALLFDLDSAIRLAEKSSGLSDNTRLRYEVWASDAAPVNLAAMLGARGLQVLGTQTVGAERDRLSRAAPALGIDLYLLAGGIAVLLAVGTVLLTAYVGAGTRRYELAALNVAGVRRWVLRAGLIREYAHLLGLPLLVGLLAGGAGAALMLPSLALVTVGTPTGPISYAPAGGILPAAILATVVGLVLAVLVVLRLVRGATPDRLREGALA